MPRTLILLVVFFFAPLASAELSLPSHLASHMVVQAEQPIVLRGMAEPEAEVVVQFAGSMARTKADATGAFRVSLPPQQPSAEGRSIEITSGTDRVVLEDVLVGEVWLCSGQSNMVWRMRSSDKFEEFQADASRRTIRTFNAHNVAAEEPRNELPGGWLVCTPETIGDFSGVAYHFGRHLSENLDVPIGLINSSWGGSRAEAWTSEKALGSIAPGRAVQRAFAKMTEVANADISEFVQDEVDEEGWLEGVVPGRLDTFGIDDETDGIFWQRFTLELPQRFLNRDLTLSLGAIDDHDTTYFNGVKVGSTRGWSTPRSYTVPASAVRAGRNVVAIQITDGAGPGGLHGEGEAFFVHPVDEADDRIAVEGKAVLKFFAEVSEMPAQHLPSHLFNGMLYPLLDVDFAGVIWYQGENNAIGEESCNDYEEVLRTMIVDWREAFEKPSLPFLIVQLPDFGREGGIFNYKQIREAQRAMLELPATGLAITIDVGDPEDIHPRNKHDIGDRLARWALVDVYDKEGIIKSGPLPKSISQSGYTIKITFETFGSPLATRDGKVAVSGFEVVGTSGDVLSSPARIANDNTVEVLIPADWGGPVAVRYGWRESPTDASLVNEVGLPASPFEIAVNE
jgi:sialate O-acetylesterase